MLLIITLLAVTLVTVDALGGNFFDPVRNATSDVVSPLSGAVRWVTTPLRNAWKGISGYEELEAENEELRAQLDDVAGEEIRDRNATEQLEKLRAELNIGSIGDIPSEIARVAAGPRNNFTDHRIELDKGANSGIEVGMPVMTGGGLLGRVERVSSNRSIVQLITDPSFELGVRIADTQDLGIGHGSGEGRPFIVYKGIELTDPVEEGDVVLTSGLLRAIMPPDVPIGTVTEVQPDQAAGSLILDVELAAKLSQIDVVQVLKWVPPA